MTFFAPLTDFNDTEKEEVAKAVNEFTQAVVNADEAKFNALLSEDLVFGHSNGSVQDKKAFIQEIVSLKPFDYQSVEVHEQEIQISGKVGVVRHIYAAKAKNQSNQTVDIRIGVMMVWVKNKSKWQLLSRQAYKL